MNNAKPILLVRIPTVPADRKQTIQNTANFILEKLNYEYHVLILNEPRTDTTFETYNDCKGLPDIDIKKLIDELYLTYPNGSTLP